MTSAIGGMMIIGSCSYFGWKQADELHRRVMTLRALEWSLERMGRELEERLMPLDQLMGLMSRESEDELQSLFCACALALRQLEKESFRSVWKKSIYQLINIQPEERAILEPLGDVLGKYGEREQARALRSACEALRQHSIAAEEEWKRLRRVHLTTAVAMGVALTILFL